MCLPSAYLSMLYEIIACDDIFRSYSTVFGYTLSLVAPAGALQDTMERTPEYADSYNMQIRTRQAIYKTTNTLNHTKMPQNDCMR